MGEPKLVVVSVVGTEVDINKVVGVLVVNVVSDAVAVVTVVMLVLLMMVVVNVEVDVLVVGVVVVMVVKGINVILAGTKLLVRLPSLT